MKKWMLCLLAALGVVNALTVSQVWGVLGLISLPVGLLGKGLRWLSLSGSLGNVLALAVYGLVCLSPLLLLRGRKFRLEDVVLVLGTAVTFWVMYLMVNPGYMPFPNMGDAGRVIYVGGAVSIFLGWAVLKLLVNLPGLDQGKMYRLLRLFLTVCAAEYVFRAFSGGMWSIMGARENLEYTQYAIYGNPTLSLVFQLLLAAATMMEQLFAAGILLGGVELLRHVEAEPYGDCCTQAAQALETVSRKALIWITLVNALLNAAQLLLAGQLSYVGVELRLPALSLGLALGALALTRLLNQGRQLKEDNDLFI